MNFRARCKQRPLSLCFALTTYTVQLHGHNVRARCCLLLPTLTMTSHSRAFPVVISASRCGHTFCAKCVLSHFFNSFDAAISGWRTNVRCPLCTNKLPATPEGSRTLKTCPFTHNRLVDEVLMCLIDSIGPAIGNENAGNDDAAVSELRKWVEDGPSKQGWLTRVRYVGCLTLVGCIGS